MAEKTSARESEKTIRYIALLDTARCNGEWDNIPELTRKVAKHAPHRTCLVLTAQTEAQIAEYVPSDRPATAATTGSVHSTGLARLIPPLLSAIDAETTHPEDAFQAAVCLGWIHWVLHEPQLAVARLPKDIMTTVMQLSEGPHQSKAWIQVCAVKCAYIKGFSQEKTSSLNEGRETYRSMIPFLALQPLSLGSYSSEFRLWSERMLSRMVAVSMKSKPLGEWMDLESMLLMFHLWISLFRMTPTDSKPLAAFDSARKTPSIVELGNEVDYSKWDVWMAYYETLSEVLLRGFMFSPLYADKKPELLYSREGLSDDEYLACKLKQRTEIKWVEASIESKLLEETRFPKATERNSRVEKWVDAVMQNWQILCGPTWRDEELGEGGKNAIARGVLDVLYRAATKSYHSTQILRYLFNVHAYVTEFDLAFKAFDSYVELVQKGKDREDKTGAPDYSLDNDDTTLHTVSEAIRILCRFGDRKEVEKAREVCKKLHQWVERATADAEAQENVDSNATVPVRIPVCSKTIAEAYRALGVCDVTWARLTYDASARNGHQQKAVEYFRTSLNVSFGSGPDLDTSYALALVLSEMRELPAAIKVVKQAMSRPARKEGFMTPTSNGEGDFNQRNDSADCVHERKLIPFWHLLTLLLTAKADIATAARTSNAAFEQFDDFADLFGPEPEFQSEHLQELEKPEPPKTKALVDRMERYEKEGIIQVKLTQIAIKEVLQNASEAVDSSAELLALYARLFGDPRAELRTQTRMGTSKPPKSAVSTLRQSVFGRIGRSRSRHGGSKNMSVPSVTTMPSRPATVATSTTAAPTIHVTAEDGSAPRKQRPLNGHSSQGSLFRAKSNHGDPNTPRKSHSIRLQKRSLSHSRRTPDSSRPPSSHTVNTADGSVATAEVPPTPPITRARSESKISNFSLPRPSTTTSDYNVSSPNQHSRAVSHNLDRISEPPSHGQYDQTPNQDGRLQTPHPSTGNLSPEPVFSLLQERRHKISLLIDLWLFIGGMYTRAAVFDDAKAAIDEAAELVQIMESQLALETSSAKAFGARGWGGGKSIEELWADVWAARGDLYVSQAFPYDAVTCYEQALSYLPDHPSAIVGLSDILLDISCEKIPAEAPDPPIFQDFTANSSFIGRNALHSTPPPLTKIPTNASSNSKSSGSSTSQTADKETPKKSAEPTPEELNRLAAKDRAYGLLSSLTKLGKGWDYSEAWFGLARSYELSGQVAKAKEVLWWCVELEDTRPIRGWGSVRAGGF